MPMVTVVGSVVSVSAQLADVNGNVVATSGEVVTWGKIRTDDRSVVVVRYTGSPSASV